MNTNDILSLVYQISGTNGLSSLYANNYYSSASYLPSSYAAGTAFSTLLSKMGLSNSVTSGYLTGAAGFGMLRNGQVLTAAQMKQFLEMTKDNPVLRNMFLMSPQEYLARSSQQYGVLNPNRNNFSGNQFSVLNGNGVFDSSGYADYTSTSISSSDYFSANLNDDVISFY